MYQCHDFLIVCKFQLVTVLLGAFDQDCKQVSTATVDSALAILQEHINSNLEAHGPQFNVVYLRSDVIGDLTAAPRRERTWRKHFEAELQNVALPVHIVSPIYEPGHFYFGSFHVTASKQVIARSWGQKMQLRRSSSIPAAMKMYHQQLVQYFGVEATAIIDTEGRRFSFHQEANNACAGYALAMLKSYIAHRGEMHNAEVNSYIFLSISVYICI